MLKEKSDHERISVISTLIRHERNLSRISEVYH